MNHHLSRVHIETMDDSTLMLSQLRRVCSTSVKCTPVSSSGVKSILLRMHNWGPLRSSSYITNRSRHQEFEAQDAPFSII